LFFLPSGFAGICFLQLSHTVIAGNRHLHSEYKQQRQFVLLIVIEKEKFIVTFLLTGERKLVTANKKASKVNIKT